MGRAFRKFTVDKSKMLLARYLIEGDTLDFIAPLIFDVRVDDGLTTDKDKQKKAIKQMKIWMRDPDWREIHKQAMIEGAMPRYDYAMNKLVKQIDSETEWLANKAANDVITQLKPLVIGEEDRSVTIRVEGMPELGTPDGEE